MRRAVLLDAFGTLVDLEPPAPALRSGLRDRLGIEVSDAEARQAIAAEIAFYRAHLHLGRDRESLDALRRRCAEVTREALGAAAAGAPVEGVLDALLAALRFRAFPEVPGALRALRAQGVRLVVVSNWDVSLHEALAAAGLAGLVDGAISSAECGEAKPAPAIFARGLELAGARAEEAVHAGDSLAEDVAGARAAGIEPVLVRRDGGRPPPPGVRAIASLSELVALPFAA